MATRIRYGGGGFSFPKKSTHKSYQKKSKPSSWLGQTIRDAGKTIAKAAMVGATAAAPYVAGGWYSKRRATGPQRLGVREELAKMNPYYNITKGARAVGQNAAKRYTEWEDKQKGHKSAEQRLEDYKQRVASEHGRTRDALSKRIDKYRNERARLTFNEGGYRSPPPTSKLAIKRNVLQPTGPILPQRRRRSVPTGFPFARNSRQAMTDTSDGMNIDRPIVPRDHMKVDWPLFRQPDPYYKWK